MRKYSKFVCLCLSIVLVVAIIPISSSLTSSALTTVVGGNIDDWTEGYITEIKNNNSSKLNSLALTEDVNYIRSGKGLNISFNHEARISLFNSSWHPNVDVSAYSGVKYWVYNPSNITVSIAIRCNLDDPTYSLKRNVQYIMQDVNGITVAKRTTSVYTKNWSGNDEYGEVQIPAGFKGTVYMPFTSFKTVPTEIGKYRLDFFTNGTASGTLYYDAFEAYTDAPSANLINDFENDVSTSYLTNAEATASTVGAYTGNALKINSNAASSTVILNGYSAVPTDFTYLRMYVKNEDTEAKISFRFEAMSLKRDTEYYLINTIDGSILKKSAAKNIFPNDWDNYLADITIPSAFEGWVYLPMSGIKNQDGTTDNTIFKNIRFDITRESEIGGIIYIDHIIPDNSIFTADQTLHTFDNFTNDGYLSEVNTSGSNSTVTLSMDETNVFSGKSIKLSIDGTTEATSKVEMYNGDWVLNYPRSENYESLGLWFKNPSQYDVLMSYRTKETNDGSLKNGGTYYLKYTDGTLVRKTATNTLFGYENLAEVVIPAGFEGYVILPFTSWYKLTENVGRFRADFKVVGKANVDIYMDNYTMFAKKTSSVPTIFSDGALFQQNKPINVWGSTLAGALISAELYKGDQLIETVTDVADGDGRFEMNFKALEGSFDKYSIVFKDKDGIFARMNDVLIGELWLSGGQSNMEFVVGQADSYEEILNNMNSEYLRFFLEPVRPYSDGTEQPMYACDDISGAYWEKGNTAENTLKNNMSAVAAVFAYELQEKLEVPVGVINTAVGGTKIHQWLSREATMNNQEILNAYVKDELYYAVDQTKTNISAWTALYNAKIAPLAGLNIAGTIWYQGESNSNYYSRYAKELDLLKESWGEIFGFENDSMPFIYTQVAPDCYDNGENNWFQLGYLAEAMNDAFLMNENNNTAMLTLYDVSLAFGNEGSIHPNVKIPVGERFANAAMNLSYGGTKEASAPIFDSIEVKDSAIYVKFTHVGEGLTCTGEDIHGFNIASEDGIYVNAKAKIIDKDTVMVWNDYLKSPANVTYAFANMNQGANLANSEGIPAAPFRSDRTIDRADSMNKFLTIEEWMFADGDAWEAVDENQSGFKKSWTVTEGAEYVYDTEIKTEGKAALKVTFTDINTVTAKPVINTYEGKSFNIARFNNIKLDVKANAEATVTLVVDGADYGEPVTLKEDGFNTVLFTLNTKIEDNAEIGFKVSGLSADAFYIDNISVGMTVLGDANDDGEITSDDLTVIRQHLLGFETEINLHNADANCDGKIDICDLVRTYHYIAK